MNSCMELCEQHKSLKEEFETYQNFAETTMQMMTEKAIKLEKKLDSLTNIVEISKYINSNISDNNLIPMINDMIIGILGVTYSSIYLEDGGKFDIKATNIEERSYVVDKNKYFSSLLDGKPFIVNCKTSLYGEDKESHIHSVIGVPIYLRDEFKGYIIVEHAICDFFNYEHIKFISSIANQIGIALENNFLYNKIKETAIRDPLLDIYNRKHFFNTLEEQVFQDSNIKFAIVMVDLDDFKNINDIYGHQFGDEVLIKTSQVIQNNLRENDILARYGGEELVICIQDAENECKVYEKIDTIRNKISTNVIEYRDIKKTITASFGVSYYPKDGNGIEKVLSIADQMLYKAKKTGKNKVVVNE